MDQFFSDAIREYLYLPLGLIPAIFFTSRLILQWVQSERRKTSYVSAGFWKLSLCGNLSLLLHHLVQVQYPFALIQGINGVVSWRNIDLINKKNPVKTKTALFIAFSSVIVITALFLMQSYFLIGEIDWIRTPMKPWDTQRQYDTLLLHLFGTLGGIVLSLRFWVQWYFAERDKHSELNKTFWCLSIAGNVMLVAYSLQTKDVVVFFHHCFGLLPYMRNLMLIRASST